ncbi:MAG TPA: DUF4245 family protein [Pseudonocardiaceae bacterium]|nr:DUF4245 family protein [Pseudonocardiaceae bacterium]
MTESTTGSPQDAEPENTESARPPAAGSATGPAAEPPAERTPARTPAPAAGRARLGLRDMLFSMIALALLVLALTAITKSCSFSPGGPSTSGAVVPTVDVPNEFRTDARVVGFPLRQPAVPTGWRANSASVGTVATAGGGQASAMQLGLITPAGHYLATIQSNADTADLVRHTAGIASDATVAAQGATVLDGTTWTSYPGVRDEAAWVADLGSVRLLVTGDGTPAEFRVLAAAVRSAPIVPAGH